jgi:hypothetical protein
VLLAAHRHCLHLGRPPALSKRFGKGIPPSPRIGLAGATCPGHVVASTAGGDDGPAIAVDDQHLGGLSRAIDTSNEWHGPSA